jgi:hypothetical protein
LPTTPRRCQTSSGRLITATFTDEAKVA